MGRAIGGLIAMAFAAGLIQPTAAADRPLAFGLEVSHQQSDLEFDDGRVIDTRESRVTATLWERLTEYIDGGLLLGVSRVSQDDDPLTEGAELTGGFGGLGIRGAYPIGAGLSVTGRGAWRYHRVEGDADAGDITLERHSGTLQLGLRTRLDDWILAGGGRYQVIEGERRVAGVETQQFEGERPVGGFAELGVATGAGGRVVLGVRTGGWQGVYLVFARRYF